MSLLSEFISALHPEERDTLATLEVRGKQADILSCMLAHPGDEKMLRLEAERIGMSTAHLHSTQSMLLRKCYQFFVPDGTYQLLHFLRLHGLETHFRRELSLEEDRLIEKHVAAEHVHDFYTQVMNLLISTGGLFDIKLYQAIVRMYERTIVHKHLHDHLDVEICMTIGDEIERFTRPPREQGYGQSENILSKLNTLERALVNSDHHLALYHLQYAYSFYFSSIRPDPIVAEQHIKALYDELPYLPENLREEEMMKTQLRLATVFFMKGSYREAYECYYTYYKELGIYSFSAYRFHLDRFIRTALQLGKLDLAQELIEKGFASYMTSKNSRTATAAYIHLTVMHLLASDTAQARETLHEAFQLNKGDLFVLPMETHLRFLEIVIAMMENADSAYIDALLTRSIKYLYRKGDAVGDGSDMDLCYALRDIHEGNKKSEIVSRLIEQGYTHYPALVILIDRLRKKSLHQLSKTNAA